jgi:hypothetical protein
MEMEGEWTYLNKYRSVLSARRCTRIVRRGLLYFVKSNQVSSYVTISIKEALESSVLHDNFRFVCI